MKMKPAIYMELDHELPAGSVTQPEGTSLELELHPLLLKISLCIFSLPGWVPVRNACLENRQKLVVAIESWVCLFPRSVMLWLQLWSKSCLRVPKVSKLDWRAAGAGMPDLNHEFSMLRLTSSGLVSAHVQTNRWPVSHLCAKQGIIMSDLFLAGWVGFFPLSGINLLESWHLSYPSWLWLLCVSA